MCLKIFSLTVFLLALSQKAQSQFPDRFIISLAHFTQPNLGAAVPRCSATILTIRHVLTTASCANVAYPVELATHIETLINGGSSVGK